MKMLSPRTGAGTGAGFTLIELLVVISIIAVLASLSMAAVGTVMDTARKASAHNDCNQIVIAVKSYYTDYGKYPVADASRKVFGTPQGSDGGTNVDIIRPLRYSDGQASDPNGLNPRQTHYLDVVQVKDQSNPKSGIDVSGNWVDPWGVAYIVFVDADYSNQIDVSSIFSSGLGSSSNPGVVPLGTGAASVGYDLKVKKRALPGTFNQSADILSWR